ncbi:iron chelate uptake ABC transporter family permease subunit [Parvibaculum sp.]|uniref:FecCD family ABC transporter permease n=1 Tax=Parvibaculum sp. TaxID=2024848 RepID=UPI000C893541|nr:iron chelate uptake ABC transporter family permease subunit [Parvibaculum sp.]MAB13530.1 hypothetical protein [Parvibaculum sp.]
MALAATAHIGDWLEGRKRRQRLALVVSALLLVVAFLAAAGQGAMALGPLKIVSILLHAVGLPGIVDVTPVEANVFLSIRLPRACLAVLSGSALAVSGAALQGLFRNPLADPGLIGVSSGAAIGVIGVILFASALGAVLPHFLMAWLVPLAAFSGAAVTVLLVYRIGAIGGRINVVTMLLAGIAINAMAGAAIGLSVFVASDEQLRDLNFWMLGSLASATWEAVLFAAPCVLLPAFAFIALARGLNALLLGEAEARHLGFDVERAKRLVLVCAALATGGTVAFTGIIAFVGLVVPHMIRLALGPDHRQLLPLAAMGGASLLLVADLAARLIVLPAELPIGVITSAVGGPFFIWLLVRQQGRGGL